MKPTPQETYDRSSEAERFVDDVTLLRMLRLRIPQADPALYAADGTSISDRHMRTGTREQWDIDGAGIVDIAHRFPDSSLAVRFRESGRWEVYRAW